MRRILPALVLAAASGSASAAEVELGYGHEVLTRGPAWSELGLAVGWGERGAPRLAVCARELERFGLRDAELRAEGSVPLAEGWIAGAEASGSPEHHFTPTFGAGAWIERALGSGFVASAGVRGAAYDGDVGPVRAGLGRLGLERYWGALRLGWTGYLATLRGRWSASNAAALDLYYGERGRLGVRAAAGRELVVTGPGEPILSDVLAVGFTGRQGLVGEWALAWEAGLVRQGDLYTRTGARLALRRHF
jgi:YaiO family outer membrane protein